MSDHGWQLALIAGLVLVSAVFSGSEMALVSLRDGQLQRLAHASAGGRVLARDPNRYLATIQIGITLVVGERVPKRIARQHPEAWALATARPLSVLAAICWTASDTSPTQPGEHVTVGRYTADVTAVTRHAITQVRPHPIGDDHPNAVKRRRQLPPRLTTSGSADHAGHRRKPCPPPRATRRPRPSSAKPSPRPIPQPPTLPSPAR